MNWCHWRENVFSVFIKVRKWFGDHQINLTMLNGFCLPSNLPPSPTPVLNGRYQAEWNAKQSQMKIISPFYILLQVLTPFRMGLFGAAHRWGVGGGGEGKKPSVTHFLHWWNLAQLYLTSRRSKLYINHVTHPLSSANISIFSAKISNF